MDWLILVVLAGWFLLSVLGQFHLDWFGRIRRYDTFGLIPIWTFFAPNPGHTDQHLIYRDMLADGSVTDWVEIPLTEERRWYSFVWNPGKRHKKILSDVLNSLAMYIENQTEHGTLRSDLSQMVMLTVPYLILLNVVSAMIPLDPRATRRQFAVAETAGYSTATAPVLLFASPFHALTSETPVTTELTREAAMAGLSQTRA